MKKLYLKPQADCMKFQTLNILSVSELDNLGNDIDWTDATNENSKW